MNKTQVTGIVTKVEQSEDEFPFVRPTTAATIELFPEAGAVWVSGTLRLTGEPVQLGLKFGVKYGPDDLDVVFMGQQVTVSLYETAAGE